MTGTWLLAGAPSPLHLHCATQPSNSQGPLAGPRLSPHFSPPHQRPQDTFPERAEPGVLAGAGPSPHVHCGRPQQSSLLPQPPSPAPPQLSSRTSIHSSEAGHLPGPRRGSSLTENFQGLVTTPRRWDPLSRLLPRCTSTAASLVMRRPGRTPRACTSACGQPSHCTTPLSKVTACDTHVTYMCARVPVCTFNHLFN